MSLDAPAPTGKTKAEISSLAERFAEQVGFLPGDRIEPLVGRLGGSITYLSIDDNFDGEDGSLLVYGPGEFEIKLSPFTGTERDRFTIAHELGHYVLHSGKGRKQIRAERFGSNRVEWEANWFAGAFLMPGEDFRRAWEKYDGDTSVLAARYLVSVRAVEVRAAVLGLATE